MVLILDGNSEHVAHVWRKSDIVDPDPDPTFKKKPDPNPTLEKKTDPDPT